MTVEHLDKIAWPVRFDDDEGYVVDCNGDPVAFSSSYLDEKVPTIREAYELLVTLLNAGHAALTGGESGGWQPERSASWQPIESAPRDGTWVLGHGQGCTHTMRWRETAFSEGWSGAGDIPVRKVLPTHWMPLPPEPKPEPEPDPWALLREMLEVVPPRLGYGMTSAVERVRQALAAHDAREGGGE